MLFLMDGGPLHGRGSGSKQGNIKGGGCTCFEVLLCQANLTGLDNSYVCVSCSLNVLACGTIFFKVLFKLSVVMLAWV
jgi:hypothetical protein